MPIDKEQQALTKQKKLLVDFREVSLRGSQIYCLCGCGQLVTPGCKFILGHNSKGEFNSWLGRKHTEETKTKQSQVKMDNPVRYWLGKERSIEDRLKFSISHKVLYASDVGKEIIKKGANTQKGKFSGQKGKSYIEQYGIGKADYIKNRISTSNKSRYASFTDEQKAEFLRNTIWKAGKHPNKFEITCGKLLDIYYPNEFKYCGNGTVVINGRNPDFIHKTKKIVVECNGLYWHIRKLGYEDTLDNRHTIEIMESEPFRNYGFDVWIIWEDKLSLNKVIILNSKEVYDANR